MTNERLHAVPQWQFAIGMELDVAAQDVKTGKDKNRVAARLRRLADILEQKI